MTSEDWKPIERAKIAAMEVLRHNAKGPFQDLPRTAGWGYPEPYTRDLLIAVFGIAVSDDKELLQTVRNMLLVLANNQSDRGHIPSLVHNRDDRGASDTTPLFLIAVAIFRKISGEPGFLEIQVKKAVLWMEYQSPTDKYLTGQLPTSDWRDEQWVLGYGLFVNTLVYIYLRLLKKEERAGKLLEQMGRFNLVPRPSQQIDPGGKDIFDRARPYYAFWFYKVYRSERFDLLGNSLAILSGIASPSRVGEIIGWIEKENDRMRENKQLCIGLAPNFFPYVQPEDVDWHPRYAQFNLPGNYHNGGIWPFVSGFYIAALVAAQKYDLAESNLLELTKLIKKSRNQELEFGFNEWYKAQDGRPMGQDWQTWSAAHYLYAAKCVELRSTPFFEAIRSK